MRKQALNRGEDAQASSTERRGNKYFEDKALEGRRS